ncbi:MAG: TetR/AcrR family transcriptional regulator [Sulfuritalea sp.]|nr:TetR/AcrR family transcriptional regulator [Sulfuritalea sp.]
MQSKLTSVRTPLKARRAQAERSEAMRRRLLEAATAVLKDRSLAGFRTAEVIALAGVSKGALLHHFPTKVQLIVAVFERIYDEIDDTARSLPPGSTLQQAINALIADSHDFFFGESFNVSLDIMISAARDPELRDAIFDVVRRFRKQTEEIWTARLTAYGLTRDKAHDAVWLVNSTVRGLAMRALWEPDLPRFQRLERVTAAIIARHLSVPEEAI